MERQIRGEILGGSSVILLGPGRDEGPQGGVGCEDAVIPVAMNPGRGEKGGQPIEELQGGEPEAGAACGIGFGQNVKDLVGAATIP